MCARGKLTMQQANVRHLGPALALYMVDQSKRCRLPRVYTNPCRMMESASRCGFHCDKRAIVDSRVSLESLDTGRYLG